MEIYGIIYKLTCIDNQKPYVGQTKQSLEERFRQHTIADSVIGCAIRSHGADKFTKEILEECKTPEQLNEREIFWIAALNCKTPNGYNRSDGGDGATGCPCSDEKRAKIGAAFKGRKKSPEHRAKIGAGDRGKKQTPEARAKISAAHTGKSPTEETRIKLISLAHRSRTSYKNLIAEMNKHHLSYADLAKILDITKAAVSAKMRGKKNFTKEQIAVLVEFFGKPAEYLFKRDDEN